MNQAIDLYEIEKQVLDSMSSHGIIPPRDGLIIDGQRHRYAIEGKDKGAAKSGAYQIHLDDWPAGWVQEFHLGDPIRWKFDASKLDSTTQAEWKKYAESPEAKAKKAEEERQRREERRQALVRAREIYDAASPIEEAVNHPYLVAKHVTPRGGFPVNGKWHGLRVGTVQGKNKPLDNVLLIPMMDVLSGELVALHRVFPWRDKETGRFSKGWHPGTSGGAFSIAGDVQRGPVFVAEGISTSLSMYSLWIDEGEPEAPGEYVPCCTVLTCMDSGNLIRQARAIREKYANRRVLIVKDADEAGEKAARAALEAGFNGVVNPIGREG
jgi:phage/plasmid primase-like uncharacterized protein